MIDLATSRTTSRPSSRPSPGPTLSRTAYRSADNRRRTSSDAVRSWLWLVAALVFVMVSVGGATRLTGSGLSITEWKPIMGAIPPLSDADWHDAFTKYQQIPQYERVNKGMSLGDFKSIFWWEWSHRLLGRLIGVIFALPLIWFWWRGALDRSLKRRLGGLLALGGLQGAIGWYMVQSGLVERVSVSQYRLALHLSLAIVLFGALVWTALRLAPAGYLVRGVDAPPPHRVRLDTVSLGQRRLGVALVGLVLAQIVLGAFVAGLHAGLTYNTWPLMDGQLIPAGLLSQTPWYLNPFENITLVQFDHRIMAYVVLAVAAWHACAVMRQADDDSVTASALILVVSILGQAALGIWALLAVVPLHLGIAHQAGAVAVFGIAVWHAHRLTRPAA